MIYAILNEEETCLHTIIKATLEWIDTILQEQKSLQVWEEKLRRVLQMITKVLQDLKAEENMVEQAKSSFKNLDRKITEAQNLSTRLPDIPHISSATAARSIAIIVQAQTLRVSATQVMNQSITKVPIVARIQMAVPIQPVVEIPILIGGYMDQKKSSPGESCFPIASSCSVSNISAPIIIASNGSQPIIQSINRAYGINDQSEDAFMEDAYSVFLSSSAQ